MTGIARIESLVVDVAADGIRLPLARARIVEAARAVLHGEGVRDALLSITFVSRARIASLNRTHLGHAGATDVISFGFRRPTEHDPVVGDVYICPDVARATAKSLGVSAGEELTRLVVHGTLHVLGHEHPEDEARESSPMWAKQEGIVRRIAEEQAPPARGRSRAAGKRGAKKAAPKRDTRKGGASRGATKAATKRGAAKTPAKRGAKKAAPKRRASTAGRTATKPATRKAPARTGSTRAAARKSGRARSR